ncbi:MAG: hypothetical protein IPG59_19850 [Candidatus Melainabacteria bacterium]|nr:MAG: hypothetical protein IPG59_19850 [Candidatus Melainabacteria bacterium]
MATERKIALTKEMEILSSSNAMVQGVNQKLDLALLSAEAIVSELDPKLNVVCEQWESLSHIQSLASTLGVNDLVVNGRHIDVRVCDDENVVSLNKILLGSALLNSGSLVVKFEKDDAEIVAYIPSSTWTQQKEQDGLVSFKVDIDEDFDLVATLKSIIKRAQTDHALEKSLAQEDLKIFLQSPASSSASLRPMIAALCSNSDLREAAFEMAMDLPLNSVTQVLHKASAWNATCDIVTSKLATTFKNLTPDEIKQVVQSTGEKYGGQPEAPEFLNAVLNELIQVEMKKKFSTAASRITDKVKNLTSKLTQGVSLSESVKALVNNSAAVDLAISIKATRNQMENFVLATAEEIGMAFQNLALQPVYATHSNENEAGVDSINEALVLLEAHEIIERAEAIKKNGL